MGFFAGILRLAQRSDAFHNRPAYFVVINPLRKFDGIAEHDPDSRRTQDQCPLSGKPVCSGDINRHHLRLAERNLGVVWQVGNDGHTASSSNSACSGST